MIAFVVVYGLDWVATVPPTATPCREAYVEAGQVVFGWVFAAHLIGAAVGSVGPGGSATPPASTPWPGTAQPAYAWLRHSSRPGWDGRRRSALDRPAVKPGTHRSTSVWSEPTNTPPAPVGGLASDQAAVQQALGRSRGGLTTKLHTICDGRGRNLTTRLTRGKPPISAS